MPQLKPHGKTETILDYLMRSEYASAGIAEYLTGESPYDNIFKAAWKGLSGKRRLTYIDLTGNVPLGLVLGIALDPFTWAPSGAITKAIKATRIPKMLGVATIKLGTRFPNTVGKAVRTGRAVKSLFAGGSLSAFKYAQYYDESLDTMKLFGIGDDIINGLVDGSVSVSTATKKASDGLFALGKITNKEFKTLSEAINNFGNMNVLARNLGDLTGAIGRESLERADDFMKQARAISKLPKDKQGLLTDIVEKTTVGIRDGVWTISSEGRKMLRSAGLTDEFIDATIRKHSEMLPVGRRISAGQTELFNTVGDVQKSVDYIVQNIDRPLIHELAEFEPLLDAALMRADPHLKGLAANYMKTHTKIIKEAQDLGLLPRKVLQNFADTMGVNYLPHRLLSDNLDFLRNKGIVIKNTFMSRMSKVIKDYEKTLKASGVSDDIAKEQVAKFRDAIQDIANAGLKESIAGADPLISVLNRANEIAKDFPAVRLALSDFKRQVGSMQELRKIMGTINEINTIAGKTVYEANLAELLFNQQMRIRTAVHYHNFLKKTADTMPGMVKVFEEGMSVPAGYVKYSDAMLGKFLVADKFKDTFASLVGISKGTDSGWKQLLRNFDSGTNIWKYTTLIPFAKFHIRNLMSEMMLNALAGMPLGVKEYGRAGKLWVDANIKKIPKAIKEYNELVARRVVRGGFMTSSIKMSPKLVGTDIISKSKRIPVMGTYLRASERFGGFAEDVPRMALYFYGEKKGAAWLAGKGFKGPRAFVNYVRKFHPVYDEFTQFEQKVMRRVMPFYSWSRFNMPLHVEMFVANPRHYISLEKSRRAITEAAGGKLPEEFTPDWLKDSVVIGVSARPGHRNYLVMKNIHPAADLTDLRSGEAIRKKLVDMLHPIKAVGEVAWGYDTYRQRKMPSVPGGKEEFFGMRLSPRVTHIFKSIRILNDMNRFWTGRDDKLWRTALFLGLGRNYDINIEKAGAELYWDASRRKTEVSKGMARAKYHRDHDTLKRLKKDYSELEKIMKKYKPKGK